VHYREITSGVFGGVYALYPEILLYKAFNCEFYGTTLTESDWQIRWPLVDVLGVVLEYDISDTEP
jgi:hypothetical protein